MTTSLQELFSQARDAANVKRVFGEPIHENGLTLIPAARVAGGGGGAAGEGADEKGKGWGGGFGVSARPVGIYVVKGDEVRWVPAIDVNRIVLVAGFVAVAALCAVGRPLAKALAARR